MGLSCSCGGDYGYYYFPPVDFSIMPERSRRTRCFSCGKFLNKNDEVLKFDCCRGDDVEMAPKFYCSRCGEIYFNLSDIGYCITLGERMEDLLAEYHELSGFKTIETCFGRTCFPER